MKFLNLEIENHIGIVTYSRPPVNAITADVYSEFRSMFEGINIIDDVRVVILRAEGKFFSVGNDVSELASFTPSIVNEYIELIKSGIGAVYKCRVPVICAVNGAAIGAAMAIAACCDVLVAAEDSYFAIPEIKVGIVGAAEFADLLVPRKVVNYMALTGKTLTAKEVQHYGGVYKVVPKEKLMDAALELANELLASGPTILRYFKKSLQTNLNARLLEKYDVEASYTAKYIETHDFKEATTAFIEKRKPQFTGK